MSKILDLTGLKPRIRATPFRTETRAFCPSCQKPVDLMSIAETTQLSKIKIDDIKMLNQNIILHPVHNIRGEIMICTESLFAFFEQRQIELPNINYISAAAWTGC